MIISGMKVRRTKTHSALPIQYPAGYTFVVKDVIGFCVSSKDDTCFHALDKLEVAEAAKEVANTTTEYTFKTQHKAKLNVTEVDISREYPYAIIKCEVGREVVHTLYFHSSLVLKAELLGLPLPLGMRQATNGNFHVNSNGPAIGDDLALLEDIVVAPWDKKDEATITVKLYSGE